MDLFSRLPKEGNISSSDSSSAVKRLLRSSTAIDGGDFRCSGFKNGIMMISLKTRIPKRSTIKPAS